MSLATLPRYRLQIIQKTPHESVILKAVFACERVRTGTRHAAASLSAETEKKDRSVLISKLGFAQIRLGREVGVFDVAARPLTPGMRAFNERIFFIFFPFVLNLNFVYINATSFLFGVFSLLLCRVYPLQFVIFEFAL